MVKKIIILLILLLIAWKTYANWTYDDAAYLAKKALIVVDKKEVDKLYKAWSRTAAVNMLFSSSWLDYTEYNEVMSGLSVSNSTIPTLNDYKYYLFKKAFDPYQAKEKLFLLFEDIFSVDAEAWKNITVKDVQDTHDLIYENMLWSYKKLIQKILYNGVKWDYSLSKYLDLLDQTNPKNPNENYSRELMQLFLMWEFNLLNNNEKNYTETDVHRLWEILIWFKTAPGHKVIFDPNINTNKYIQFLSWPLASWDHFPFVTWENQDIIDIQKIKQPINGNNWLPDNIINYIFSKRRQAIALFLANKLYKFYIWENPTKDELKQIANKILQENFVILPIVKRLLSSDIFYAHKNEILFKNPIELVCNLIKKFKIPGSYTPFIKYLNRIPYEPWSIFGRDWFDDNSLFFTPAIWLAWTHVSAKFARRFIYNKFKKNTLYFTNFVWDNRIFDPYDFIENKTTFDSNKVAYITWYIDLNNLKIWSTILTWGKVLLWENKIQVNGNTYSYNSFSINFPKMEIYFSWNNQIYTWSIDFLNMKRGYTPEEIISYFENMLYIDTSLSKDVEKKLVNFLETDLKWNKTKFDSRKAHKLYALLRFLLNQPEYILKSGYKDKPISVNFTWWSSDFKLNNNKLILFRLAGGFDPLSVYIPKNQYKLYKELRKDAALTENEITNFWKDYYINKIYTGFIHLLNDKDLYVVNRIWLPNGTRWHNYATYQISSVDDSISPKSLGIIWAAFSWVWAWIEDATILSPSYPAPIFNGTKSFWIWPESYVYWYDIYKNWKDLLTNTFATRSYPGKLKKLYDTMLLINSISDKMYKKTGQYSYREGNLTSIFNYLEELINQNIGKAIDVPVFGGYDMHSNVKARMEKAFSQVDHFVSKFYNDIKNKHNVTIVIFSEFWRTLRENTSKWVDHGVGGSMFIITNNKKLRNALKTQFIWNMDFKDSKHNWLGVGIDNRAVWKVILKSLYNIDISKYLPGKIYLSGYLDHSFWEITNFNRSLLTRNHIINFNFNIKDRNFIPTEASYIKLEYGTNPNNLYKESIYRMEHYMDVCKEKTDLSLNCSVNLKLFGINPNTKYYYKLTFYDDQYNKRILTWSFISAKVFSKAPYYVLSAKTNSYIDEYYTWFNGWKLNKKIYLSLSWTRILTGKNNFLLATSWTYIKSIDIYSWAKWNWWFVLPEDINPNIFLDKNTKISGYKVTNLHIWKLIKVGSDVPGVKMNLSTGVYIILNNLDASKKYKVFTSEAGKSWSLFTGGLIFKNGKYTIKTNHFSYYLLVETDSNGNLISNSQKTTSKKENKTIRNNNNRRVDHYSRWGGGYLLTNNYYYKEPTKTTTKIMKYMKKFSKTSLKNFSTQKIKNSLLKLIKIKYIWNYQIFYLTEKKYNKYNKVFEEIAKIIINKNYKWIDTKARLIDILNSIITYFAIYKETPSLRKKLRSTIIEKIIQLDKLYKENLIRKNKTISYKKITKPEVKNNTTKIQKSHTRNKTTINKTKNNTSKYKLYSVAVHSIWLKADPYWRRNVWILKYGDVVQQLTPLYRKGFFKVKVIKSYDVRMVWEEGYIFRKYLRKE